MSQEVSLEHTIYSVTNDCPACHARQSDPSLRCLNCNAILVRGLRHGTVIANTYEYICPIGSGGMGLIVKAVNKNSQDEVAVKLLLANASGGDNRRFQQEAQAASMLTHKHIIHVRDFGFCDDDAPYMVMDYVVGDNLANVIAKKGSLDLGEALDIFDQICDAMSFAHSKGVVHRDLKPSNIMLTGANKDFVTIVDFGIAKILEGNSLEQNLTQTGQVLGSPLYMSPEQALGAKVDLRTDIYSAGCVLFHALTGAPPIEGASSIETLFKHLHQTPSTLAEASLGKHFPADLEEIVAKTLKKEPNQRYQSFDELRSALGDARSGRSVPINNPAQEEKQNRFSLSRQPILVIVACLTVLMSGAGVLFWITHTEKPTSQKIAPVAARPSATKESITENSKTTISSNQTKRQLPPEESDEKIKSLSQIAVDIQIRTSEHTITLAEDSADDADLEYLVGQIADTKAQIDSLDIRPATSCYVSDAGLKVLKRLPLKELTIARTKVTGDGLEAIAAIKSLQELHLNRLQGTNAQNLACLGKLKNLKILDLSNCPEVNGSDLAVLLSMKGLTALDVSSVRQLGDDGMRYIASLPHLAKLNISWTRVRDRGLEQLARVRSLRTLSLEGLLISNEGLKPVARLPQLFNLNLSKSHIDRAAIQTLSKMRSLNRLYVWNCPNLKDEDIMQLQTALGKDHVFTAKPSYKWDIE